MTLKNIKMSAATAHTQGLLMGGNVFLKYYDKYRKLSGPLLLLCSILFLILGNYYLMIFMLALTHIHVLANQLWWKLLHIEKQFDEVVGNSKTNINTEKRT